MFVEPLEIKTTEHVGDKICCPSSQVLYDLKPGGLMWGNES